MAILENAFSFAPSFNPGIDIDSVRKGIGFTRCDKRYVLFVAVHNGDHSHYRLV